MLEILSELDPLKLIKSKFILIRNILVLNNYSNILVVPKASYLYESFSLKFLSGLKQIDNSLVLPSKNQSTMDVEAFTRKNLVSFVETKQVFQKRTINDIRFDDSRFCMELNVISTSGGLAYWDSQTHKSFDDQKKGGKSLTPYFNMTFLATDDEHGAAMIKLYLCSYDGEGEGFLGSASEADKNDKKMKDEKKPTQPKPEKEEPSK